MLRLQSARVLQTAVFLLLPLLLIFAWLPLLPERAELTMAAARGQLLAPTTTALDKNAFSPLWFGLLTLANALPLLLTLVAAAFSALGWGTVVWQWSKQSPQIKQKWAAYLLPLLLLVSPLLPATLATAVSWQLVAILLVTKSTQSQQWRTQTISLILLPLLWSDWPAWLLAGWALWQRRQKTGHTPILAAGVTAVLFLGGNLLRIAVWGRLAALPQVDLLAWQAALTHLHAESDFYGLALLLAVLVVTFSVFRNPLSLINGLLLWGAITLLVDPLLGMGILLLAVLSALANSNIELQKQLQPQQATLSPTNASLVLTLLLAVPLFLAQGSSLWQRYQARPLAHAALLAQAGAWLTVEVEAETAVLAPTSLANHIPQSLWSFPAPASPSAWGTFMTALSNAPPQHIVSNNTLAWDALIHTGWFQERYRPVQHFATQASAQSPVTVWAYNDSPFDQGETVTAQVFGDNGLHLVSYRYWPRTIQPGEAVYLTLDWQTTTPLRHNVDTIVRLMSQTDQVGWAQQRVRTPQSLPPAWISPETVTFSERFVLTTTTEIPIGVYQLNTSLVTGRDSVFTSLYQNEDVNALDRILLGYVNVPWAETIPDTAVSMNAHFGDQITLHSYTLEGAARPGEVITPTLYWEAVRPPDADYTVFVHLLDGAGNFVTGFDSVPLYGRYPTNGWLPGSLVPDPHPLTLPPDLPPGEYQIWIGLYLPDSGERLTAVDANGMTAPNNTLFLKTITVPP